ncbi:MAG: SRPBCC domain-containing protein [Bacteroidota bacterium]
MQNLEDAKSRTLTIEKELNAPLALVWEAWSKPEHIAKWWGPKGMEITVEVHDFRVGGHWRYSMQMPDGNTFITEGTYLAIDTHRRIVTSADFKPMTENVELHILFEAQGEKTLFTFHCVHKTEEYCAQQEKMGFYNGWGSVFNNLKTFVETSS